MKEGKKQGGQMDLIYVEERLNKKCAEFQNGPFPPPLPPLPPPLLPLSLVWLIIFLLLYTWIA